MIAYFFLCARSVIDIRYTILIIEIEIIVCDELGCPFDWQIDTYEYNTLYTNIVCHYCVHSIHLQIKYISKKSCVIAFPAMRFFSLSLPLTHNRTFKHFPRLSCIFPKYTTTAKGLLAICTYFMTWTFSRHRIISRGNLQQLKGVNSNCPWKNWANRCAQIIANLRVCPMTIDRGYGCQIDPEIVVGTASEVLLYWNRHNDHLIHAPEKNCEKCWVSNIIADTMSSIERKLTVAIWIMWPTEFAAICAVGTRLTRWKLSAASHFGPFLR